MLEISVATAVFQVHSILFRSFYVQVRSEITFEDLADEDLHHKFEAMVYLSLPIRTVEGRSTSIGSKAPPRVMSSSPSPEVNLVHCLEQFANHEELAQDDWAYCERTRRCERSSVKMDIWSAPECLIIHLKRFAVDATTGARGEGSLNNRKGLEKRLPKKILKDFQI